MLNVKLLLWTIQITTKLLNPTWPPPPPPPLNVTRLQRSALSHDFYIWNHDYHEGEGWRWLLTINGNATTTHETSAALSRYEEGCRPQYFPDGRPTASGIYEHQCRGPMCGHQGIRLFLAELLDARPVCGQPDLLRLPPECHQSESASPESSLELLVGSIMNLPYVDRSAQNQGK